MVAPARMRFGPWPHKGLQVGSADVHPADRDKFAGTLNPYSAGSYGPLR
jgi:hypothetical protein